MLISMLAVVQYQSKMIVKHRLPNPVVRGSERFFMVPQGVYNPGMVYYHINGNKLRKRRRSFLDLETYRFQDCFYAHRELVNPHLTQVEQILA